MKLKILGSIAPYPKDSSNCSSYLVSDEKNKILLDCGNGSSRLLNMPEDLKHLTVIISHLHPDHYADIFGIVNAANIFYRKGLLDDKVDIYIYKASSSNTCEEYYDFQLINSVTKDGVNIKYYDETDIIINDFKISFCKTHHSVNCCSIKITNNNKSLVYTGDTGIKALDKLSKFGYNCDILLSESSLLISDNIINEYHMHAFEAATLAKNMNCKRLILTHFWPEYDKEKYAIEAKNIFDNVSTAYEKMIIDI